MNAERLLAYYEQIADAPDAIARLRRFVLDLAVRGKLVPQDPDDEPASELLKRIAAEKARLVEAGEIRKFAVFDPIAYEDQAFEIPRKWEWVRLGEILTKLTDGTHHSPPNGPDGDFKYITAKNIKNDGVLLDDVTYIAREIHDEIFARCNPAKGDILYIKDGATTGVVTINDLDEPFSMLSSVALLKLPPCLFNRLIVEFLRSPFFYDQMRGFMKGAAITRVTLKRMGPALFPLPPLAEQHRIVAKVDELMALCDQLEAARTDREASRDRLAAVSLARLNTPAPETFEVDARFARDALPALTTRPDQIKALRQTILNLAVRGKLVPQDPNDEPALELLKRIAQEKAQLVKAGEIKKEKPLDPITRDNQPFELPKNWSWARLDSLSRLITKGSSPKWQGINYVSANEGILFITSENVGNQELRKLDDLKHVESRFRDIEPRSMLKRGDILMNLVGASIGRTATYNLDLEANINQAVALIRLVEISDGPLVRYLLQYFNSPTAIDFMLGSRVITAQPNMSLTDTREFPIPLPPLAEQHRIVAKVDELMALCDQLEDSLTNATGTRSRLLNALLAEALMPLEIRELEAAE